MQTKMTLNEYCKEKGLGSYHELIAVSGKSRETLTNWMNSERNKKLIDALIELAVIKKSGFIIHTLEVLKKDKVFRAWVNDKEEVDPEGLKLQTMQFGLVNKPANNQ